MLTLNNIKEISLEKAKGGYRKESVEEFVTQVIELVTALESEKTDLQKKIVILAEKIEEYKKDEENIKLVLVGAQRMAEETRCEAEKDAETILMDARDKADNIVGEAGRQITQEQAELYRVKKEVSDFKAQILALYKEHLELISRIPNEDAKPAPVYQTPEQAPAEEPAAEEAVAEPEQAAEVPEETPMADDRPSFSAGFVFKED